MSAKARAFVDTELRGAEGRALKMWQLLAECADDHGVITMSLHEIAAKGGIGWATAQRWISKMVEAESLARVKRYTNPAGKGGRESDVLIMAPYDKRTPMGRIPKQYREQLPERD